MHHTHSIIDSAKKSYPLVRRSVLLFHLVIVIVFSCVTRFYKLGTVPSNIQPDAVDTIRMFVEHQHRGDLTLFSTNWNGSYIVNQYLVALPWELTGRAIWGIRLGPAVLSIIGIVLFYFVVWRWTKRPWLALSISLLFASDPWLLNFSRSGWENIANIIPTLGLLFVFTLSCSQQRLRWSLLFAIGVISPYLYHPGKLIGIVAIAWLLLDIARSAQVFQRKIVCLGAVVVLFGVLASPLLLVPRSEQLGRIFTVSVFNEPDYQQTYLESVQRNVVGFITFQSKEWRIGLNSRYLPLDGWVLPPVIVVLYLLGTVAALRKHWPIVILGLALIFPINLLSRNTPDAARSLHALPYIYVMAAFGLNTLVNVSRWVLTKLHLQIHQPASLIGWSVVTLIGCMLTSRNLQHYWLWINDPRTIAVREPAISTHVYSQWLDDMNRLLEERGRTISIYEWQDQREITLPSN